MQVEDSRSNSTTAPEPVAEGIDGDERDVEKDAAMAGSLKSKSEDGENNNEPEPPYSIFSVAEKRFMVLIASLTTLFPPLTSSMYYPVITLLATDLDVSINSINLTITTYLVWHFEMPPILSGLR